MFQIKTTNAPQRFCGQREFVVMTSREAERQRKASQRSPFPRVIPWLEWVKLRGISPSTAERLRRAGKVKVTQLSPRRIGVREDHDQEYLDSCARGGA
jgi:hypothetical protein